MVWGKVIISLHRGSQKRCYNLHGGVWRCVGIFDYSCNLGTLLDSIVGEAGILNVFITGALLHNEEVPHL